ncbi:hypothetical protein QAD02_002547 [Eretmocerus hayati]|uniref:Uncharacterized protein n=1 Tax=Eretmocerus hayati TaxID=131215 RepID=A0ACC2NJB2_9HYME|nr:hypothetical protein QAD02_002547 [Eretmocerus hayati]
MFWSQFEELCPLDFGFGKIDLQVVHHHQEPELLIIDASDDEDDNIEVIELYSSDDGRPQAPPTKERRVERGLTRAEHRRGCSNRLDPLDQSLQITNIGVAGSTTPNVDVINADILTDALLTPRIVNVFNDFTLNPPPLITGVVAASSTFSSTARPGQLDLLALIDDLTEMSSSAIVATLATAHSEEVLDHRTIEEMREARSVLDQIIPKQEPWGAITTSAASPQLQRMVVDDDTTTEPCPSTPVTPMRLANRDREVLLGSDHPSNQYLAPL